MFAELNELQERWRSLTDAEKLRADRLLQDADRAVRRDYPTVATRAAADPAFAADVAMIICNVVRRAMWDVGRPAEGVIQESDSRGPFTITRRFSDADGDLDFTANEQAILQGALVTSSGGLPIWTGTDPVRDCAYVWR